MVALSNLTEDLAAASIVESLHLFIYSFHLFIAKSFIALGVHLLQKAPFLEATLISAGVNAIIKCGRAQTLRHCQFHRGFFVLLCLLYTKRPPVDDTLEGVATW